MYTEGDVLSMVKKVLNNHKFYVENFSERAFVNLITVAPHMQLCHLGFKSFVCLNIVNIYIFLNIRIELLNCKIM